MTLIKTSLLNAIAVGIRMLTLLGINKILAIYVGPVGYAALGQFQNAVQMITTLASGAINTGVTKYTAENQDNEAEQHKVWQTAGTIALGGSLILSALVFVYRSQLALKFLGDSQMSTVFVWLSATLVLFVFNTLLLAILNGKRDIPRYVLANILGSVLALVITALMVVSRGLLGALIALTAYQSLAFFVTLLICSKTSWFKWRYLFGAPDKNIIKNLLKYTAMALTTATVVPLNQILIRDYLSTTVGREFAGYWEAMWRLSGAYLMLISTTLSIYYLPKISELKSGKEIKNEIYYGYRIILPAAILCSCLVYFLRDIIIYALFSSEFGEMRELFFWQLIGDVLKIGSWIFAFVMLAKSMMREYIFAEIVCVICFYVYTRIFVGKFGFVGVSIAHALNYATYWLLMYVAVGRRYLK